MTAREKNIQAINNLFPVDSPYADTNEVGWKLLRESIEEAGWQDLPDSVLSLWAQKCIHEERRQAGNTKY